MQVIEGWSACPECEALIEADNWAEMTNRSIKNIFPTFESFAPETQAKALTAVMGLHAGFRRNRINKG
jgi:hypothetical protein